MKKLRVLIFALGLSIPMLAGAAIDRYSDPDRSVVQGGPQTAGWCWICVLGWCYWVAC